MHRRCRFVPHPKKRLQFSLSGFIISVILIGAAIGLWIDCRYRTRLVEVGRYLITVDYSKTLEKMIALGNYEHIYKEINSDNFPIANDKIGKVEQLEVVLFGFENYKGRVFIKKILEKLENKGFRPATFPELLALGERYPKLLKLELIAAVGSEWRGPDGAFVAPALDSRGIRIVSSRFTSRRHCRFLAIRK